MREESHLDEMRTAIRGDFERLKERRGEQELMRVVADASPPEAEEPEPEPEPDTAPVADVGPPEAVVLEVEPTPPPETEVDSEPSPVDEPEPKRSWLQRFLSP